MSTRATTRRTSAIASFCRELAGLAHHAEHGEAGGALLEVEIGDAVDAFEIERAVFAGTA
jgi:hypothetical protein